jgi:hypothetical protein
MLESRKKQNSAIRKSPVGAIPATTISCRKAEIDLNLPHEQPVPSACQIVGYRSDRSFATTKAGGKILLDLFRITH